MSIQSYFNTLCKSGNLEEAQQYLLDNPTINISANNEKAFLNACFSGHLEVAQWLLLLSLKPDINISANYEEAFRYACFKGHLLVAQWLLSVKPDINISAKNEQSFRNACFYGRLLVAQWLLELKPNLYVINYNDDGSYKDYYIRSKEEARWEQRKYLVWLASNESPNKNSLFYKIPQDVSRYIISNYL
jgi:hypothetical protein